MAQRVLVMGTLARSLVNFRGALLQALRQRGHEVVAAAAADGSSTEVGRQLLQWGVNFEPVALARGGTNPLADAAAVLAIRRLYRRVRPDVVLAYTIKPVVYGGIAARLADVPRSYPLITGLGYAFMEGGGLKRRMVRAVAEQLYRRSLSGGGCQDRCRLFHAQAA